MLLVIAVLSISAAVLMLLHPEVRIFGSSGKASENAGAASESALTAASGMQDVSGADFAAAGSAAGTSSGVSAAGSAAGAASSVSTAGNVIAPQAVTESSLAQSVIPDRSDFAVDSEKTGWNYDNPSVKTIYLTFDDGPSKETQSILDTLDKYGVKATFFVTSEDPSCQDMIKTEFDKGHTVGLHTYSHEYSQIYASTDAYFEDLRKIASVVKGEIGFVPCFIRFPGGSSNESSEEYCTGIMTALAQDVQDVGYQYWDWNVSCGDGTTETTEDTVANATADSGLTNIVLLMHDAEDKESTADALPAIIEYYKNKGYTFRALDRTSTVCHHKIAN